MGQYLLKLPKMGESVAEATVTKWLMEVGDKVVLDDAVLEIATDKVDTDVTSEVTGVLFEKRVQENEVVSVGAVLAVIEIEGETTIEQKEEVKAVPAPAKEKPTNKPILEDQILTAEVASEKIIQDLEKVQSGDAIKLKESANFYSPLVRNIAQQEGVSVS